MPSGVSWLCNVQLCWCHADDDKFKHKLRLWFKQDLAHSLFALGRAVLPNNLCQALAPSLSSLQNGPTIVTLTSPSGSVWYFLTLLREGHQTTMASMKPLLDRTSLSFSLWLTGNEPGLLGKLLLSHSSQPRLSL